MDTPHEFRYGLPAPYRDAMHTDIDVHFSLWDRIKILFGGVPVLRVNTMVENPPGLLETEVKIYVRGPIVRRSKMIGVAEAQDR